MSKTLFIIAGFKHTATEEQYDWIDEYFTGLGYIIRKPNIDWNNKTIDDYVKQFSIYYNKFKSKQNLVLGFSFGAMIALISNQGLKPDRLYLCSLSPYFSEDLPKINKTWIKFIGINRFEVFKHYSGIELARNINVPTKVFYGSIEGNKYPQLKIRCQETSNSNNLVDLIVVPGANHQINHPSYISAIKKQFSTATAN